MRMLVTTTIMIIGMLEHGRDTVAMTLRQRSNGFSRRSAVGRRSGGVPGFDPQARGTLDTWNETEASD